jgi:hypothetical protein
MFVEEDSQEMADIRQSVALSKTWFAQDFATIHNQPREERGGILLACPVWGESYITRFAVFCVTTLLAPANAAALADGRSRIVLFTDEAGVFLLTQVKRRLEVAGIDVRLYLIPSAITALIGKNRQNRYTLLSVVHNLGVQMAGRLGMGFNMMAGDHSYAADFFPNLKRLATRYHAIAQSALSADIATVGRDLAKYFDKDRLAVPGDRLTAIAWKHLHPQMRWMTVGLNRRNITTRLPGATWLAWRGQRSLSVISPHMNVTYLSPLMCRNAPTCVPDTLDTALPAFMPAGAYIPKPGELDYIEVSDADKGHTRENLTTAQWVDNLWHVVKFKERYLPFMQPCEIAIPYSTTGLSARVIERQRAVLMQALVDGREMAKDQFIEHATAA